MIRRRKIFIFITSTLLSFFLTLSSFAGEVMVAPTFLPGFPMVAGENVMLMWVPVQGAVKYKIYQNGKLISEPPTPPFTNKAPEKEGVYKYTITGVDKYGNEGPFSKEGVISIIKLKKPKKITYTFMNDTLILNWDVFPNDAFYKIYKSYSKEGPYKYIDKTTEDRYIDHDIKKTELLKGLEAGEWSKPIYYRVDRWASQAGGPHRGGSTITEFKIQKKAELPIFPLKIMRTKHLMILKPDPAFGIKSVYDAKFFKDKKTMVYSDPTSKKIVVIDKFGDIIWTIGEEGTDPDQFEVPFKLDIDTDDNIYVSDGKKEKFFAYDSNGEFIYSAKAHIAIEKEILDYYEKSEPFKVTKLAGIAIYDDRLYIAEKSSGTIQIYNKRDGNFIGYLKNKEANKILFFPSPISLILDKKSKKLYVSCSIARKIYVVNIDTGEDFYEIGKSGNFIGGFMGISGMCFDNDGNIIVTDPAMHSLQVFSKEDGGYMYHIGGEKAIPDPKTKGQSACFKKQLEYPIAPQLDNEGRLRIYIGGKKIFMVREFIGNKPWDSTIDEPEGECE